MKRMPVPPQELLFSSLGKLLVLLYLAAEPLCREPSRTPSWSCRRPVSPSTCPRLRPGPEGTHSTFWLISFEGSNCGSFIYLCVPSASLRAEHVWK